MREKKSIIWVIVAIAVAAVIGAGFYMRESARWQQEYRDHVSQGIVSLLQDNPYDQTAVFVIVIDGLRWEEGIGAEDTYLPHIWNDLRPLGTLLTNYYIESPTATTSSHSAMVTGRISTVPNDGHIRPVFPNMQEYFRDARTDYLTSAIEDITRIPAGIFRPDAASVAEVGSLVSDAMNFESEKTAFYLGKDLIHSLNQTSCGRYPGDDVFLIDSMRDIEITDYFRAKIPDVRPNMVVVNLGDVDEAGHEVEWHYYVDAIRWADRHVWEMWSALQAETRYRDRTYFIITTDHGRHIIERGGYPHHGDFCEGCRHSFMLLIGPGIREGFVSDEPHSELDLVPTVGRAVGFATPGCSGSPMEEIFENPDSLPERRMTETMEAVDRDRVRVDERDTPKLLLDAAFTQLEEIQTPDEAKIHFPMMLLAAAARIHAHPDEAAYWRDKVESMLPDEIQVNEVGDMKIAYPLLVYEREVTLAMGAQSFDDTNLVSWDLLNEAKLKVFISPDDGTISPDADISTVALVAPLCAAYGASWEDPDMTRFAYKILFNTLVRYEGEEKVFDGNLEDFIDDYLYRQTPNEIFTLADIPMRDRMWLVLGIERVLAEARTEHARDLDPLLQRQYRLLIAFMSQWQDANAMVGGTGALDEGVDIPAQGLALASIADFQPWRRWELDQLGYTMNIYRTPIFSWPPEHFFYILGQGNALAGAWAADTRMKLYVNDDGAIRHDLIDAASPVVPSDPAWLEPALTLAYGLSRFEQADYNMFDLEIYPIVHQQ